MPKIPECERCLRCAHNPYIVCAIHPDGVDGDRCLDFREDPHAEPLELWEPEGASYYNGELILQPKQRWTPLQQLELLDYHPMFTGRCPNCEMPFPKYETSPVHWDCNQCGWMDDSVWGVIAQGIFNEQFRNSWPTKTSNRWLAIYERVWICVWVFFVVASEEKDCFGVSVLEKLEKGYKVQSMTKRNANHQD